MGKLYDALIKNQDTGVYPFHMPGHKRRPFTEIPGVEIDITEITDFDNLHHAEGILKEAQKRTADLYHASESFFLVNGSTSGILSAISACTRRNGTLLMARNSHKAAYHGVLLQQLKAVYLYPEQEPVFGINGGIQVLDIEEQMKANPEIKAVFITSPTYDGVVSDIKGIAEAVHKRNGILIVDEAHGAHFGFHSYFPQTAVRLGADIVIQSFHKTLPSLTQTAVLHVNGDTVDRDKLRMYLQIYQTSSPSYLFMSSIDSCTALLERDGQHLFTEFAKKLQRFREKAEELQQVRLVNQSVTRTAGIFAYDLSKLVISFGTGFTKGEELARIFREEYQLEMEMAAPSYCLGLTSIADKEEGFERLLGALSGVDSRFQWKESTWEVSTTKPKTLLSLMEAIEREKKSIPLEEGEGCMAGEFVYVYPPGIPLLVPGEQINKKILDRLLLYRESGFSLQGMKDYKNKEIQILL